MILKIVAIAAVALVGAALWVRLAPDDPNVWHVDPATAKSTGKPNEAFRRGEDAPFFAESPSGLMRRLEAIATAEPRTSRLAGDPEQGFATYVQRSTLWGFPDYVSARAVPEDGGARLVLWSRSRYGYSDMGVNEARAQRWLGALNRPGS